MHNGEIPDGMQIDHINGVKADNRIENLRVVTGFENAKNKRFSRKTLSGVPGVNFSGGRWVATCMINRVVHRIGRFTEIAEAARAVKEYRAKHGFTERHGEVV